MSKLRKYFENNRTSYTYLFFAATSTVAYKAYFQHAAKVPQFVSSTLTDQLVTLVSPLIFTVFFLFASIITFEPPKNKWISFILGFIHGFFYLYILVFFASG